MHPKTGAKVQQLYEICKRKSNIFVIKLGQLKKNTYLCARIIVPKRNEIDRHHKHVLAFTAETV